MGLQRLMQRCHTPVAVKYNDIKILAAGVLAASLAGCVSTSKVMPAPGGLFMIKGRANGPFNDGKETSRGMRKANEFCAKQSKHVVLHNMGQTGNAALLGEHVIIIFDCE
jgi:hypothetical protein